MGTTIASLLTKHQADPTAICDTVRQTYHRIEQVADPAIFLALRDEADVLSEAQAMAGGIDRPLDLLGVPVAIKDNIDVAGLATTAACPHFAYLPGRDSTAVKRLRQAGALIIGKTNLDQFATGLVGA